MSGAVPAEYQFQIGAISDVGSKREQNEDHCGYAVVEPTTCIVAVADGVSGYEGGAVASQMAIDVMLRAYNEQPATVRTIKRLYRAVQQANIEIYDKAVVVPELRSMATTLTAIVIARGELIAAHVGDTRLYRVRDGQITQLTKDHTVAAERARLGLLSDQEARTHPERSTLTRSVGRQLIVSIDQLTTELEHDDVVLVCSDGLYNTLADAEMRDVVRDLEAPLACRALIDRANERGSHDNVTAAVVRMTGHIPARARPDGLVGKLRRLFVAGAFA